MVTATGEWDWDRLKTLLPSPVLEFLAATLHHWRALGMIFRGGVGMRRDSFGLARLMRASTLWRCVLGQEIANGFDALPFDVWLHGNITGRLINEAERADWGMRFSVYCWLLWKRRCSLVLDVDFIERETVLDWSNRIIEDCKAVYSPLRTATTVVQRPVWSWEGPPHGWVKGNVDAAVNVSDGRAAVGGSFETRDGLHQAWNGGFRHVELETDNAEAARICNGLSTTMQHSVLVSDIQEWLQRCWQVRVRYVDRSSNAVADKLAKMGQRTFLQRSYFQSPPVEVIALVDAEQRHWEDRLMGS
ncbi:hypothetical protein V6N11_050747 [Hibiscus sabdariffa]|uniref:RNase H type-1 domain-containing protein n=1 Tax=Hibiscus sabdariffa TaxID=183260 RepID=A0ABR2TAQ4_9ROSI